MDNLSKQAGYLKGLLEGSDTDMGSAKGKLLAGIVDMLGALSERVEALDDLMEDLNDYVESIDDDLTELEGGFDDDEDDDDDFEDDDFDDDEDDDEDDEDFEDQLRLLEPEGDDAEDGEVICGKICPECSRTFFTRVMDDEGRKYICPFCGKRIVPDDLNPDVAPIVDPLEDEE